MSHYKDDFYFEKSPSFISLEEERNFYLIEGCRIKGEIDYVFGFSVFKGEIERVTKFRRENNLPLETDEFGWFQKDF